MYNLRTFLGGLGFALATLIAPVWQPVALAAAPQVTGVRVGVYPAKTRIVLDVSSPVKFSAFILPEPYRVVVDMSEVTWSPEMRNPPSGGLVTGMRFGLFKPGSSRVVLDSAGPVRVAKAFIIPPSGRYRSYRLVVDIAKTVQRHSIR